MKLPSLGDLKRPAGLGASWWLILLSLALWVLMVLETGRQPSGDGPASLGTAMRLAQLFWEGDWGTMIWCFQSLLAPHPPFAYLPATLCYILLGPSSSWAHLLSGALVMLLCWDGVRRLGGGSVGAIWLAASSPLWLYAESYGVDLLAAAAVVQSVSHLAASERLKERGSARAWGAWMGVAFMTKYTAPMFLWAPCLLAGWWVIRWRRWSQLGQAVGFFLLVAGPWYLPHGHQVWAYLVGNLSSGSSNLVIANPLLEGPWYGETRIRWYPAALVDALGWPGVLGAGLGLLAWPRRAEAKPGSWGLPLLAFLGGALLLAMQLQRQDRYLLPAFPLLAALAATSRWWWLLALAAIGGAYGNAAAFAGWSQVPSTRSYEHDWSTAGSSWPWPMEAYRPTSVDPAAWRLPEAIRTLREVQGSSEGTVGLTVDEEEGVTGFGPTLMEVARQGHLWHLTTVAVGGPAGPDGFAVFAGPFATDDWPSRDFTALVAVFRPGRSPQEAWLKRSGLELVKRFDAAGEMETHVYRSTSGPVRPSGGGGAPGPGPAGAAAPPPAGGPAPGPGGSPPGPDRSSP